MKKNCVYQRVRPILEQIAVIKIRRREETADLINTCSLSNVA